MQLEHSAADTIRENAPYFENRLCTVYRMDYSAVLLKIMGIEYVAESVNVRVYPTLEKKNMLNMFSFLY